MLLFPTHQAAMGAPEYRNGDLFMSNQTIACNPGGGTVDCVRWARIDPVGNAVLDPDGLTFWYLGQYSKPQAGNCDWATYIGSYTFPNCTADGIFTDGFESGDTSGWDDIVILP